MNKIIPFTKDINFNEKIGEIVSIALDDFLKLETNTSINGELVIYGCQKKDDLEKNFKYSIPVDITIDPKYDTSACNIKIDDFYYEIINDEILRVNIDLMIDNLCYIKEEKTNLRLTEEIFDDILEESKIIDNSKNIKIENEQEKKIVKEEKIKENSKIENLFKEVNEDVTEYSIYRVYTVLENETLEYILDKYKVTKEDLMYYNDLEKIKPGMKLIIPSIDE